MRRLLKPTSSWRSMAEGFASKVRAVVRCLDACFQCCTDCRIDNFRNTYASPAFSRMGLGISVRHSPPRLLPAYVCSTVVVTPGLSPLIRFSNSSSFAQVSSHLLLGQARTKLHTLQPDATVDSRLRTGVARACHEKRICVHMKLIPPVTASLLSVITISISTRCSPLIALGPHRLTCAASWLAIAACRYRGTGKTSGRPYSGPLTACTSSGFEKM